MTVPGIQTYLFFEGRCEEAIEFYKSALGAKVEMLMRFKESPEPPQPGGPPPGSGEKIMHANVKIGDTTVLMSDGQCRGSAHFAGFSLTIAVPDEATADKTFNALAEGGKAVMPMAKTFFSPRFGMTFDKFGVMWMVMVRP